MLLVQLKTQNVSLVMTLEIKNRLIDLLDEPEYLDLMYDEWPHKHMIERVDNTHVVNWYEWKSLNDKLKWEEVLNEIV